MNWDPWLQPSASLAAALVAALASVFVVLAQLRKQHEAALARDARARLNDAYAQWASTGLDAIVACKDYARAILRTDRSALPERLDLRPRVVNAIHAFVRAQVHVHLAETDRFRLRAAGNATKALSTDVLFMSDDDVLKRWADPVLDKVRRDILQHCSIIADQDSEGTT